MSGANLDAHELREFAADLTRASQRVVDKTPPVIKRGATQIKAQLRQEMSASLWFKGVARSISYDVLDQGFVAEIGPESEPGAKVGDLASIAYFGGARGGGGTVPDPQGALDAEAPRVEQALLDLVGDV